MFDKGANKEIQNESLGSQANIVKTDAVFIKKDASRIFSFVLTMCNSYKNPEKVMF